MAAIRPESCRLYDLNVVELLRDTEEYMGVLESLGMIGVTEEHLERMATNPRHQLFLLLGPTDTWDEHGPTVYCAIQACLEGEINDMPDLDENDPFKREIRKSFQMFPQLPNNLLVGVRVVEVFLPPNLQLEEEAYESTALMLLRRYFNGEAAQHVIQEVPQREQNILTRLHTKQGQIHYIATFANPLMDDVRRWERNGLELFFVGYIQEDEVRCIMLSKLDDYETFINRVYNHCSPDDLFKGFGQMFISLLRYWRDFDRVLALRILRDNMALVREGDQGVVEKPWANNIVKIAEQRMEAFIGNHGSIELVADLVPGIAQSYFGGKLRINLAENEEYVLLLMGLNGCVFDRVKEAMNHLEEAELLSCLRRIFITAVDYFNIPEVVDDDN